MQIRTDDAEDEREDGEDGQRVKDGHLGCKSGGWIESVNAGYGPMMQKMSVKMERKASA